MSGEQNMAIGQMFSAGASGTVLRQQHDGNVQEIVAGAGATGNTQNMNFYQGSGNALYASLSVQDGTGQIVYSLSPGQWYKIQITTQSAAVSGGQPIQARQQISYRLRFVRADDLTVIEWLPALTLSLTAEEINEARQTHHSAPCSFQVPAQAPALTSLLILYVWDLDHGEQEVYRLPNLPIEGQGNASAGGFSSEELKLLETEELELLDLAAAPDGLAYIYVRRPNTQIELQTFCKGSTTPPSQLQLTPPVEATYQGLDPMQWIAQLRNFSGGHLLRPFWGWLGQLKATGVVPTNYIWVELTDSGLPWELIDFRGQHLGCQQPLSRWAEWIDYDRPRMLRAVAEERAGRVLALLAPGEASPPALNGLATTYVATASELWAQLFAKPTSVALVYLSARASLARTELINTLYVNPLGSYLDSARPLFIVGGQGSVATVLQTDDPFNLARTLLLNVADGLIGIASPHFPDAAVLAEPLAQILPALATGQPVAEALRQVRQACFATRDTQLLRFLASFVYVYYGNPLLRLHLEQAP